MRLCWTSWAAAALLAVPVASLAANCTTQAELLPQDRNVLVATAGRLSEAVLQQDYAALQAALLPAVAPEWEGIRGAVEQAVPLVKGGQVQLRSLYLLDASSQAAPADTQFFCSNASGSLTVTITMRALPPGRYAVVLADAAGAPLGGQLGFILAWDNRGSAPGWKLGGLSVRQGIIDGMMASGTGHAPRTGQRRFAMECLVLLRDRACIAGAGGFSLLAKSGKTGRRTGAVKKLSVGCLSLFDSRRPAHLED